MLFTVIIFGPFYLADINNHSGTSCWSDLLSTQQQDIQSRNHHTRPVTSCLFVCLFVCLSVCLFVYLFCLFVCLFVFIVVTNMQLGVYLLCSPCRTGALFFIVLNQMFSTLSAIELFIKERAIFM